MSNHNLPGNIRHAPGVTCLLVIKQNEADPIDLKCHGLVVLKARIFPGQRYTCGCGNLGRLRTDLREPLWDCEGDSLYCGVAIRLFGNVMYKSNKVTHRSFPQSWLVPIADGDTYKRLFESEMTDEEKLKIAETITMNDL